VIKEVESLILSKQTLTGKGNNLCFL